MTAGASREHLQTHFADLEDAVLLSRLASGTLTEIARQVASEEAARRGLQVRAEVPSASNPEAVELALDASDSLSIVAIHSDWVQAHLVESRLRAEGIPAFASNGNVATAMSYMGAAAGGIWISVPTRLLPEARRVLAQLDAGEFVLDEDDSSP